MERYFFSLRIAAAVTVAALAIGWARLELRGYAVLHDPDGLVASATLVGGGERRPMRLLTRGHWVGRPIRDGAFEVTCVTGQVVRPANGHVAAGAKASITVDARTCNPGWRARP